MTKAVYSIQAVIAALLLIFSLSGCGHYQMGMPSKQGAYSAQKIYVEWVENNTFEAAQVVPYTQAIREMIIESGYFELAPSPIDADAILSISLESFSRNRQAHRSDDTGLASIYRGTMEAVVSLIGNADGRMLVDEKKFALSADALVSQGLQAAEYQQTHTMARQLANRVRDTLHGLSM